MLGRWQKSLLPVWDRVVKGRTGTCFCWGLCVSVAGKEAGTPSRGDRRWCCRLWKGIRGRWWGCVPEEILGSTLGAFLRWARLLWGQEVLDCPSYSHLRMPGNVTSFCSIRLKRCGHSGCRGRCLLCGVPGWRLNMGWLERLLQSRGWGRPGEVVVWVDLRSHTISEHLCSETFVP